MNWLEFKGQVGELCFIEEHLPKTGMENFYSGTIRAAVIDLQSYISTYTEDHETEMRIGSFVQECNAMRGLLPERMLKLNAIYFVQEPTESECVPTTCPTCGCTCCACGCTCTGCGCSCSGETCSCGGFCPGERKLERKPWDYRLQMIEQDCSSLKPSPECYSYASDDRNKKFYIFPLLTDTSYLRVEWDGYKSVFNDNDKLPWGEEAVTVVADFVKAKMKLEQEKIAEYKTQFASYLKGRSKLYREQHDMLVG